MAERNTGKMEWNFPFLRDRITRMLVLTLILGAVVFWVAYTVYQRIHLFTDYSVTATAQENDVDGTLYQVLGSHVIKYSHDGVFCVDMSNNMQWSSAYSMQTPISDVSGSYMVIAEQQGKQVYVLNEAGVQGSFETDLPIIRVKISTNGVVALMLDDGDVTWINLVRDNGEAIASVKTSVAESGYPMDMGLSRDAVRMMVSFVHPNKGKMEGVVAFYDFSSAAEADDTHLIGKCNYTDSVFPEVYYTGGGVPVALADTGYVVFTQNGQPKEKQRVTLEDEIVSTFHENGSIGFIFRSKNPDQKYSMQLYNLRGQQMMETAFNYDYTLAKMENDEILLYDAAALHVWRVSGKEKFSVQYKKEVYFFASLTDMRRYLVVTDDSMDRIRIS